MKSCGTCSHFNLDIPAICDIGFTCCPAWDKWIPIGCLWVGEEVEV